MKIAFLPLSCIPSVNVEACANPSMSVIFDEPSSIFYNIVERVSCLIKVPQDVVGEGAGQDG